MRITLSAGEASGDAMGAGLARAIRDLAPEAELSGLGGARMAEAGVRLVDDSSRWGAISVAQSLRVAFRAVRGAKRLVKELRRGEPGVFVPIDFGFLNVRLARKAKSLGWKVLYFMPPASWRRDRQGADLPSVSDEIVTPFSWSAETLREMGATVHWYGHPLKALRAFPAGEVPEGRYVAALPGSRSHELASHLPYFAEVVRGLPERVVFALPKGTDAAAIRAEWGRLAPERTLDEFRSDAVRPTLAGARAALVCSGTATLEAALAGTPMVVVYVLSPAMRREAALIRYRRPRHIALPNILLDRRAVPEHAEREPVDPAVVRADLDRLLADSPEREGQIAAFRELDGLLGPGEEAFRRTAERVVYLAGR